MSKTAAISQNGYAKAGSKGKNAIKETLKKRKKPKGMTSGATGGKKPGTAKGY